MINQYADGAFERCLNAIDNDPRGTVERSGPRATASLSLSLCFLISVTFFFTGEVRTTILGLVKILPDTRGHSETRSPSDTGYYFSFFLFCGRARVLGEKERTKESARSAVTA